MTQEEDFIVREPYQPTEEEKQAIAELESRGLTADDWDSTRKRIKSFKENLRNDMYEKQNGLCVYCRGRIPKAYYPPHREHIVHKAKHPQWTFLPENLCVSCYWCNKWKDTTEVLIDPQTESYPKSGKGFKLIHPLYDKYSEHIELIGDVLYRGKTEKGVFTINTCHLYRVDLAEERVDEMKRTKDEGSVVANLAKLLTLPDPYVDDKDGFLRYVTDVVKTYKEKQVKE